MVETLIALHRIPFVLVEAGMSEAARQRALQLFPAQHAPLSRKRDYGRTEVALVFIASMESAQHEAQTAA